MALVQKNDSIHIDAAELGGSSAKKVTIQWSQSFSTRSEDYYACSFTDNTNAGASGVIYVQVSKADELKCQSVGNDNYTVNDSYQYGQNIGGTNRFLIFHNSDNRIYQHRFIEGLVRSGASDLAAKLGVSIGDMRGVTNNYIGDFVRNF